MLLVPSRYEPCGLTQMLGMRYGCLPIVRETGGLADTVENYDNLNGEIGTGFKFLYESVEALIGTIGWALDILINRHDAWERLQENGMRCDWSWSQSTEQYITLYEQAIAQKRVWRQTGRR
jgi:starch synthase